MTSSVSHLLPTKLCIQIVGLKLVVDQTSLKFDCFCLKTFTVQLFFLCAIIILCLQHLKPHNLSFQKGILRMQTHQDAPPCFCTAYKWPDVLKLEYQTVASYFNQITNFNYLHSF